MTPSRSRTFLLTGVTGFLGKVMLEELVRRRDELGIERIGVVIRPMRGRGAEERFQREVTAAACFARLPSNWADIVTVIEGNLEELGLGLAPHHERFLRRVTHVVHAAASVKFDLAVAQAAGANITASLNVLALARTWPLVTRFIYVSTAYVTPSEGGVPIAEALVALPNPAAELYAACVDGSSSDRELLERTGHPNSYTLTKAIAEHLLVERRGGVPLTIIRPSVITAAFEHPFPGWIDSTAGYAAFVMFVGTGHLRAVVCRPDARLDLVPVDEVANRITQASMFDSEPVVIRHAVIGAARSPTMAQCWDGTQRFFRIHRVGRYPRGRYLGPRGIRFAIANVVQRRLPIVAASFQSQAMRRQAEKRSARIASLNEEFTYFTTRTFDFQGSPAPDDRYQAEAFVDTVCRGVYRHLLAHDEAEWVLAGRSHAGHAGDLRWVLGQPNGNAWIRTAAWMATKVLRRATERVTVDVPAFERARAAIPADAALVLTPSHRSYLDFVLSSYLAFARPDLLPIPHVAATTEFGKIPVLGRILTSLHAFYVRRGEGEKDPDLARRVNALLDQGRTLEFFIEGQRSRTGEFLSPKRGLLRCLQASGRTCALLPITLRYDRVPEQEAFRRELAGHPRQTMRLRALLSWLVDVWRGRVDLGRVHISCGAPVMLDANSDVRARSHEVIDRLRAAMAGATNHVGIPDAMPPRAAAADAWPPPSVIGLYTGVESAG